MTIATGTPRMNPTAVPNCPHLPISSEVLLRRRAPVTKPEVQKADHGQHRSDPLRGSGESCRRGSLVAPEV
jgi:hypothetical protein